MVLLARTHLVSRGAKVAGVSYFVIENCSCEVEQALHQLCNFAQKLSTYKRSTIESTEKVKYLAPRTTFINKNWTLKVMILGTFFKKCTILVVKRNHFN